MKDQRLRLTKTLLKLAPDITASDRTYVTKKLKVSKVTISNFLNGHVSNNDLAISMIEIFTERIAEREAKMKSLCQNN